MENRRDVGLIMGSNCYIVIATSCFRHLVITIKKSFLTQQAALSDLHIVKPRAQKESILGLPSYCRRLKWKKLVRE